MVEFTHIGIVFPAWVSSPSHRHDVWELVLYTSGTGHITVGDSPVPFEPGTIVCLPPHIPHGEQSDSGYTNIHMVFRDFRPSVPGIPVCRDDTCQSFRLLATQLHREFQIRQHGWQMICDGLAEVLARYIERWTVGTTRPALVDKLISIMAERMHEPGFSVKDAMRGLTCTSDHARRTFTNATGRTPLDYLTDLRMREARHLLDQGVRIQDAAERVGIPDPYYFSRVFRRHEGLSPSQWRLQRQRESQQSNISAERQNP